MRQSLKKHNSPISTSYVVATYGVVVSMMGFMAVVGEYFASFLETVVGLSAHLSSPVVTGTLGVVCVTSLVLWVCSCLRRSKDKGEWGVLINDD